MAKKEVKYRSLDSKAVINTAIVDSQPYYYSDSGRDIVPFGEDNIYPDKMLDFIKYSPTASGCTDKIATLLNGHGFRSGGIIVNRYGETLNDILKKTCDKYSKLKGFCLHVNFNLLGMVTEIFGLKIEHVRKLTDLKSVDIGLWNRESYSYINKFENIELFGCSNPIEGILRDGIDGYKGQVAYYSGTEDVYPDSSIDGVSLSAGYEKEVQVYSFANVKNSFSANKLIKVPTTGMQGTKEEDSVKDQLGKCHGAENAGHSIIMPVRVNDDGNAQNLSLVEDLNPSNVDGMFTKQNERAERNILKAYKMPPILLGADGSGMFNTASYSDAFNYMNENLTPERNDIERVFSRVLENSIFNIDEVKIIPLEMKNVRTHG